MRQRTKPYRPHHHALRVAAAALLGIGAAILATLAGPALRAASASHWAPWLIGVIGAVLLPALILRHCRHWRWCFAVGAAAGGAMGVALVPLYWLWSPWFGLLVEAPFLGSATAVLCGLGHMATCCVKSWVFGTPVVQDGTMCPGCAYSIQGLPESRCPECGRHFTENEVDPVPRSSSRAWRQVVRATACMLAMLGLLYLIYPLVLAPCAVRSLDPFFWPAEYFRLSPRLSTIVIRKFLADRNPAFRRQAAFLVRGNTNAAAELRIAALSDADAMVRMLTIQSLGQCDVSVLLPLMPRLLTDPDPGVRDMALGALAWGGDIVRPEGPPYLIRTLDDPDPTVRVNAYQRLMGNTKQSIPYNPMGPRDERLADQARWQACWDAQDAPISAPVDEESR